jgi:Mce-associated membrane protein
MSPSWYDLLDVAPDATTAEIKTAWQAAITDLDPTDRRFRVFNQAAEVLLDSGKRAAYDAELAAAEPERVDEPEAGPASALASVIVDLKKLKKKAPKPAVQSATSGPAGRRTVPGWLLGALAVLTAIAVGLSAWLWFERPSDAAVEDSTQTAQSAAERAIGPILSYDAKQLDEDQQAAASYMTSDYREEYDKLFAVIKENAPATQTVVDAQVIASGIVRSGEDRVAVLLFVNRPTTNKQNPEPIVYKDQVTVTMQKVGDEWLVDDLVTTPVGR